MKKLLEHNTDAGRSLKLLHDDDTDRFRIVIDAPGLAASGIDVTRDVLRRLGDQGRTA